MCGVRGVFLPHWRRLLHCEFSVVDVQAHLLPGAAALCMLGATAHLISQCSSSWRCGIRTESAGQTQLQWTGEWAAG